MSTVIKTSRNGQILSFAVAGIGELKLDVSKLSEEIRDYALFDRLTAKVVDNAAISRDSKTGASATPQAKYNAMREMIQQLENDEWTVGSLIYSAIAEIRGIDRSRARAIFDALTEEQKKAVRTSNSIRAWYAARRKPSDSTVGEDILANIG